MRVLWEALVLVPMHMLIERRKSPRPPRPAPLPVARLLSPREGLR